MTTTPEREALAAEAKRRLAHFGKATVLASMFVTNENIDNLVAAERQAKLAIDALAASPAAGGVQPVVSVFRGGTTAFGRATVVQAWLPGEDALPDGEHLLYAHPPAAPAQAIRYDGLHEYAEKHRLDYNELCCVARTALASQEGAAK